jgi:16S rRNA (cytosine1402-N4)-methyltransferase
MTTKQEEENLSHRSVLYHEIIHEIAPKRGRKYVDGTLGAGGHARGILEACSPDGRLLGLDVDSQAISLAEKRLSTFGERVVIMRASYASLSEQLGKLEWERVDGILLDLGASSMQFDTPERGFSFQSEGPLDMRYNIQSPFTASDIVNTWDEEAIADILYRYGEERRSRHIARKIIEARPVKTTTQLAEVVARAVKPQPKSRIHPATRTFQAIRMAVNEELDALEDALPQAVEALAPGGRLAVISFHSLEDRIVKRFFREHSQDRRESDHPMAPVVGRADLRIIHRKPIVPSEAEVLANPRSRSAKLRVAEKI